MKDELSIEISGMHIFPEQGLEDKLGFVARIDHISVSEDRVRIGIQNKTGELQGYSGLDLTKEDFEMFFSNYRVKRADSLVGKPVISVYTRYMGQMLCGLIPLDLRKR